MKPYYVAPVFYFPMQHAISLINQGRSEEEAAAITIRRFAYFGKKSSKRLKTFDQKQFRKHLHKFINTKGAVLTRKPMKRGASRKVGQF